MRTINTKSINNFPVLMLKLIKNSVLLFCFLAVNLIFAQENTIGLEESKQAALNYSNDIKTGKLRVEEAEAAKKEAFANYFPSVDATGVGLYGFNDLISPLPGLLDEGYWESIALPGRPPLRCSMQVETLTTTIRWQMCR